MGLPDPFQGENDHFDLGDRVFLSRDKNKQPDKNQSGPEASPGKV